MELTVILSGQDGDLLLEPAVNDTGWTSCSLLTSQRIYLGADTLPYVTAGLLKAVSDNLGEALPSGEIAGYNVRYLFILAEAHHALYVADEGDDRLLFWQNAHQAPVTLAGIIRLSPAQRQQWQSQLHVLRKSFPNFSYPLTVPKEIAEIVGGVEALK
jgi:hypothetical protein